MDQNYDFFIESLPPERDLLGHDAMLRELTNVVVQAPTPMAVMLNGGWGTGKTTFISKLFSNISELRNELEQGRRPATVWFDPWEHEHEPNILTPFLLELRREAYRDDPERQKTLDEQERNFFKELLTMLVPASIQLPGLPSLSFQTGDIARRLLRPGRNTQLDSQVQGAGLGSIRNPDRTQSRRIHDQFRRYVDRICGKEHNRLIIFLDDLDRCQPSSMLMLLDIVKVTFLRGGVPREELPYQPRDLPPVIFVFAIDQRVLVRAVAERLNSWVPRDYSKYLDKIFDLRVSLPEVRPTNVKAFLLDLLSTRDPAAVAFLQKRFPAEGHAQGGSTRSSRSVSLLDVMVEIALRHNDLRNPRIIKRVLNKLMLFARISPNRRKQRACLEGRLRKDRTPEHVIVAWHALNQAWFGTRDVALRDDGLGVLLLHSLWERMVAAGGQAEAFEHLREQGVSPAGLRFFNLEIKEAFAPDRIRRELSFYFRSAKGAPSGYADPEIARFIAQTLAELDYHVRTFTY